MKSQEDLNELKEKVEKLYKTLVELTDDELEQVTGGDGLSDFKRLTSEDLKLLGLESLVNILL